MVVFSSAVCAYSNRVFLFWGVVFVGRTQRGAKPGSAEVTKGARLIPDHDNPKPSFNSFGFYMKTPCCLRIGWQVGLGSGITNDRHDAGSTELKMAVKLVDRLWSKILDRDAFAKQALKEKIIEVQQLEETIKLNEGPEVAKVALKDGLIVHALQRCLENLQGSRTVTEQDYWVNYEFATAAAKKAEEILNEEDHVGSVQFGIISEGYGVIDVYDELADEPDETLDEEAEIIEEETRDEEEE
jgi:hypothetical protein